ncbi:MAG: hypothetical protein HUU22_04250 [Phycisphaerae bacterium]|nr:hypothetical protein [Phycisphaerae bacterium]NUQ45229.1 hypothetical protein [Phycisphaerae bacterium]
MDAEEIYRLIKQQPFQPFRVHVSDGTKYDILHPDRILIGKRALHVGVGGVDSGPAQKIEIVANIHVTRITPLSIDQTSRSRREAG